jgi:transcription termination/antitermination protein NusG
MNEEQSFTPGEMVELINGPFMKFIGKVRDVNNDTQTLVVIVEIFGRDTPIELKFQEVKKRPDISPW